jgi:hypothetical protein
MSIITNPNQNKQNNNKNYDNNNNYNNNRYNNNSTNSNRDSYLRYNLLEKQIQEIENVDSHIKSLQSQIEHQSQVGNQKLTNSLVQELTDYCGKLRERIEFESDTSIAAALKILLDEIAYDVNKKE